MYFLISGPAFVLIQDEIGSKEMEYQLGDVCPVLFLRSCLAAISVLQMAVDGQMKESISAALFTINVSPRSILLFKKNRG